MDRTPLEKLEFLKEFLITNFKKDGCVDLSNLDLSQEGLGLRIDSFKGERLEMFNPKVAKSIAITGAQADIIHANSMTARNLFAFGNKVEEVHQVHALGENEEYKTRNGNTFVCQTRRKMTMDDIERELGYKVLLVDYS